ncbi:MarR family winged helix-turn-helix transcriptional regulator [Roseburia sp. 499]|uniref:MarR family winged helix-turn-helix transcriptional regulator n=1 Tax=Roseburia sp. 499 TaxID=1261634 RepID=UPI00095242A2|nr:MarR family transcriptional regulator [Roseburia sp. 499]WVK70264.1 MarR family transcriptional regulator [Roseburia sp. 499]
MTNELELLITGRQFQKMCEREYETIRKKYDLRKVELDMLYFLDYFQEARTAKDIAKMRQVSKAHISSAVENLVGRQLLETREDPEDRRRMLLELTEAGGEIVKEVALVRKRMTEIVYDGITDQEKQVMQQAAKKMMQNMQKEIKVTGKENAQ